MTNLEIELVDPDTLTFDKDNPRLAEFHVNSEKGILKLLWEIMDIKELIQSIQASGFFPNEPLITLPEKNGHRVVIEGNRRLAAVKILRNPALVELGSYSLPKLTTQELKKLRLDKIPVMSASRKEMWRYLGFRHVNGPAKWSGFAKACYIAEVHSKYETSLADIATQIGDRHGTVQKLYRGLMVLRQAERLKVFDQEDRFQGRLAFSHLYTGLDYDGFKEFLHLSPAEAETPNPVPEDRKVELGEIMLWLYGSKSNGKPPLIQSQNPDLRRLNESLKSPEAISAMRAGKSIDYAFEVSRPPAAVFEEAILAAKRELSKAQSIVSTGYSGAESLFRIAEELVDMAEDLHVSMQNRRKQSKKRRTEETA